MPTNISSAEQPAQDELEFPEILSEADIASLLMKKRASVRALERQATQLLKITHSLAEAQSLRDQAADFESDFTDLCDLLGDRIVANDPKKLEIQKELRKQFSDLKKRSVKISKKLHDDMFFDLMPKLASALGVSAAVSVLARIFCDEKSPLITFIAEAGIALGFGAAYHEQIENLWNKTALTTCKATKRVNNDFFVFCVKESLRERTAAATMLFKNNARRVTQPLSGQLRKLTRRPSGPKPPTP